MPKKPEELSEQIESQEEPADPEKERTAEGLEVETPTRGDFFGNLERVTRDKN